MESHLERCREAELHRLTGDIAPLKPAPRTGVAEQAYRQALAVAKSQRAKGWELRAASSLARLWRGQGKRGQARDLLAPVYTWFSEGFDTADLKDAKALLAELE